VLLHVLALQREARDQGQGHHVRDSTAMASGPPTATVTRSPARLALGGRAEEAISARPGLCANKRRASLLASLANT
jgi:hypothetical protein